LLKRSSVPDVERSVGRAYHDAFGAFPTFRLATPGTGARELQWQSTWALFGPAAIREYW